MTNLIVDIGNSFYKVFVFKNETILKKYRSSNLKEISRFINHLDIESLTIDKAIIATVKSEADKIYKVINDKFETIKFDSKLNLPIKILYKTPESLGKDRVAAICGAVETFPNSNILVIDAGTAITYDFVDKDNNYHGGNISPGLMLRFKALYNFTDKLPLVNIDMNNDVFLGHTTKQAILSGVQNGILYEVEAYIYNFRRKYPNIKIILTGGDAFFFEKLLKSPIFVAENLTAKGLNKILNFNV